VLTPWGACLDRDVPLPEHPRPQLYRDSWTTLNGSWDHAFTSAAMDETPTSWDGPILVPFSPEAPLSGVGRTLQPDEALWYRRTFEVPEPMRSGRVLLHFGAVDQLCEIRIDGIRVGEHTGGFLPFSFDITDHVSAGPHELVVRVRDLTDTSWHARGKQRLKPGGIWYSPQSGIWQTVWLEAVPTRWVERLVMTPRPDDATLDVLVFDGAGQPGQATVVVRAEGTVLARAEVPLGERVSVPLRGPVRLWSPEDPFLHDVEVQLSEDLVRSQVGMRSFGTMVHPDGHTRFTLNGKPILHAGLLDQGYWPDGLLTAPSDEALVHDIQMARGMGFNVLRKHIKIEALRWYHHCDRLGMIVWQDMVNGGTSYNPAVVMAPAVTPLQIDDRRHALFGRADAAGRTHFLTEVDATVELLRSVTCIVGWVPFNEGWGQFDAAAVASRVKALDPTRLVDHASGWHDQGAGDIASRHVYFRPYTLSARDAADPRAAVLSEYGGYSHRVEGHTWSDKEFGYRKIADRHTFELAFNRLHHHQIGPAIDKGLAGFVYTQLSDVEQETNGLLTYDRRHTKIAPPEVHTVMSRLHRRFHQSIEGSRAPVAVRETELTEPVSLTLPDGRLNPDAVGWARTPLVTTDGIGRGRLGRGRNKRWEYWAVTTPTHVVALVTSDIDYASVHGIWLLDRATNEAISHDAIGVLGRSITLPGTLGAAPTRTRTRGLTIDIDELADGSGTRLRARGDRVAVDVVAHRPPGHECLAVVVPWSDRLFQYTVKDVARPASGTIWVDGTPIVIGPDDAWATLDHGRGRWPYDVRWNWGAGSGTVASHRVGIQVGGQWTDGTGSVENAIVVDGRLTKISEELVWTYDPNDWMAPWTVVGEDIDLRFEPFHLKRSVTDLKIFSSRTHQCFGTWSGRIRPATGEWMNVSGLTGWAEDVHNRW
jgi:hypothetical protein